MNRTKKTDNVGNQRDEPLNGVVGGGTSKVISGDRKRILIILALLLLVVLCAWGISIYIAKRNEAARLALIAKSGIGNAPVQTPASMAKSAEASDLSKDDKAATIIAASFRSFYAGDNKTALSLSEPYIEDSKYRRDLLCGMYIKIYESQKETKKVVDAAKECAGLYLKDLPKDELAKQLQLHSVAKFYDKAGNEEQANKYFSQFIAYVEKNNKQEDELVGPLYLEAKEATKL